MFLLKTQTVLKLGLGRPLSFSFYEEVETLLSDQIGTDIYDPDFLLLFRVWNADFADS
jgi:hypothetical protein